MGWGSCGEKQDNEGVLCKGKNKLEKKRKKDKH